MGQYLKIMVFADWVEIPSGRVGWNPLGQSWMEQGNPKTGQGGILSERAGWRGKSSGRSVKIQKAGPAPSDERTVCLCVDAMSPRPTGDTARRCSCCLRRGGWSLRRGQPRRAASPWSSGRCRGDRVGEDDLLQGRRLHALRCGTAHDAVAGEGAHAFGACLLHDVGSLGDGAKAVSTMSSTMMTSLPFTSPMICMLSTTLARARVLLQSTSGQPKYLA